MIPLALVLAALGLSLPFPEPWLDTIQVYQRPTQAQPGALAYVCFPESARVLLSDCPVVDRPTIMLEPLLGQVAGDHYELYRNVVAHETFHLWAGITGPPEDQFLERQAYRFGCNISWVSLCPDWIRRH